VLSNTPGFTCNDCQIYSSLPEALIKLSDEKEVFIIGGSQLFSRALPLAHRLYLTRVHAVFPEIDCSEWVKKSEITYPVDEKNSYSYTFYTYEKKEN
jgi:dihydrofolate reductase